MLSIQFNEKVSELEMKLQIAREAMNEYVKRLNEKVSAL